MALITNIAQREYTTNANRKYARRYISSCVAVIAGLFIVSVLRSCVLGGEDIQSERGQVRQDSAANQWGQ